MAKRIRKSEVSEALHSSASALLKAGAISNATMRDFDALHMMVMPDFKPKEIVQIRSANNVSQPVFAMYLGTSESTVQKWESGAKKPSGMAMRLIGVVKKHGVEVLA